MNIKEYLDKLYTECAHGDDEHQVWLKEKFEQFYEKESLWNETSIVLPETGIEVLGWAPEWEEEDETSDGIRVCFLSDEGYWTISTWSNYQDCYSEKYTKEWYTEEEVAKIKQDYGPEGSYISSNAVIQNPPTKWMYKIPV